MPTDQVDQAEVVEAKSRNVSIVYEVLTLGLELVVLQPVAAYGQHLHRAFFNRHYIRQCYTRRLAVLVLVLVPFQIKVDVHLQQLIPVVHRGGQSSLFVLLLLNLVHCTYRVAKIDVAVEASNLELSQLVLGFTHAVGNPLCIFKVLRTVGHDDVFSRDEHRRLAVKAGVKVDFLERIARQTQADQHALMLGAVLAHHLG